MTLNGTIDSINVSAAVCGVRSLMTINKDLDLFDLMCWLAGGCLAIVWIVGIGYFLLVAFLQFRTLLELPCG